MDSQTPTPVRCTSKTDIKQNISVADTLSFQTYVDNILPEPLLQVVDESDLAGVVLQEHGVLDAHPVPVLQRRLHTDVAERRNKKSINSIEKRRTQHLSPITIVLIEGNRKQCVGVMQRLCCRGAQLIPYIATD